MRCRLKLLYFSRTKCSPLIFLFARPTVGAYDTMLLLNGNVTVRELLNALRRGLNVMVYREQVDRDYFKGVC